MSGMRAEHFRFILDANVGGLRRNLNRGGNDMGRFSSRARKEMRSVNRSITSVGRGLTGGMFGGGAGLTAAFGLRKVIRDSSDFEFAMNQVQAVSKATGSEFGELRAKALGLGNTTQFTAGQVGDAMRFMAMAGLDTGSILGGIESALHLASAGNLDLGESADIVTNILTAYGLEIDQLGHATDVLAATFTSANTDLRQLGQAFKFAAPIASSAGIEFEEAAAALGLLGNAGFQAEMGGTALRGMFSASSGETTGGKPVRMPTSVAASTMRRIDRPSSTTERFAFLAASASVLRRAMLEANVVATTIPLASDIISAIASPMVFSERPAEVLNTFVESQISALTPALPISLQSLFDKMLS